MQIRIVRMAPVAPTPVEDPAQVPPDQDPDSPIRTPVVPTTPGLPRPRRRSDTCLDILA